MKKSTIPIAPAMLIGLLSVIGDALTSVRRIVTMFLGIACITTFIVISSPVVLHAQTEWKDNYVTLAVGDQTNPAIAYPATEAYTVIVWEDIRDSVSSGTDIYAQKIDNSNGLPMWEPVDGVQVCTARGNQSNPRAAYDSLGNIMVVWEDHRDHGTYASIYAQSLALPDGSVNANWSTDGEAVCDLRAHAERPRIAGGRDGAFIAWVDWRNSSSMATDSSYRDIYLQYMVTSTGSYPVGGNAAWASNGVLVPDTNIHDDTNVELARDFSWPKPADSTTNDGVMLVYESKRVISATTSDSIYVVYADRFDANGTRRWGDLRLATYQEAQVLPQLEVLGRYHGIGDSVAVVVWQDMRPDPDPPVEYDIYSQHVSKHTGEVLGTPAGDVVCDQTAIQRYPVLSLYEREEDLGLSVSYLARVVCAWEDLRNAATHGVDLFAAVMDGVTCVLTNTAGTTGEEICTSTNDQMQVRVDNYGDDEMAYFVWRDGDDGGADESDIWYQDMDLLTCYMYQSVGVGTAVTEAKGNQTNPQVGGDVFAWADKRRETILYDTQNDWNIYAETPGTCVGPTGMNWRDMWADVHPVGDAAHMRFAVDSAFNVFVVWQEPGDTAGYQDVYIQKLDKTGVPRWTNSGLRLNTSIHASEPEVTISDSLGGAQVTWQQTTSGSDTVYYAKISSIGEIDGRMVAPDAVQPVIDYAQFTMGSPGAASDYPAYIGVIPDAAEVEVYSWDPNSTAWEGEEAGQSIDYEDIILDATESGDFFLAGWEDPQSSGQLQVVWGTTGSGTPLDEELIDYDFFGGCDIAADYTGQSAGGYTGGFIVYSAQLISPDPVELYAHVIESDAGSLPVALQLTNTLAIDGGPTNPAMCQDSSINASGYSGMLVAWNLQYQDPYGQQRHQVMTNKFEYISVSGVDLIRWSNPVDIIVSQSMTSARQPDIVRLPNSTADTDTMSIIVWEGVTEVCSPSRPKEIVAEWVIYDSAAVDRGAQWVDEKPVGPGPGTYSQTLPIIRNSAGNTVNVFWCDGRASKDMVMGTRFWVDDSDINWMKQQAEPPRNNAQLLRLGANYPNPLSLQRHGISHLDIDVSIESNISLRLYDNLGGQMALVYEGRLPAGVHTMRLDASRLSPGMYHYVLRGAGTLTTRGLVIVR